MESKNIKVVFRKSMHGYNKKDVNNYIVRLSRDFFEKEQKLKSDLRKAQANAILYEAEIEMANKLRDENERLLDMIEELKNANSELTKQISETSASNDSLELASPLSNIMSVDFFNGGLSALSGENTSTTMIRDITEKIKNYIRNTAYSESDELMESIDREMSRIEKLLFK